MERRIPTWEHVPTCRRSSVSTTITQITLRDSCLHLRDDKVSVWAFHNVSADGADRVYKKKKEKTAHKQQPTHGLRKTPTQHLILFSLSMFWSCNSLERNRTLLLFLDNLLLFRVSPLSSFYYKTKLSAGNRWSGETSTEQTERRKRARRTEKRKHGGRHTNMRLQSGEQGRTTSAKHVSYDKCCNGSSSGSWNSRLITIPWWQIAKEVT